MRAIDFFSRYNLIDDVRSILIDLIYNDQIIGPSNLYEEEDMERTAKLAVCTLLNTTYADRYGEIHESDIDFEALYETMYNAIYREFNHRD